MKIFVTGASGFVGGAVAEAAVKRGDEVVAMSRSERSDDKIRALGAEPVRCSLDDISSEHMKGCDAVVHAAAYVEEWGSREDYWIANVTGTQNVLAAAKEAGVKRFVHIGTEAALFRGQPMRNIDESYPYPASTPFLYSETKREAEKLVLAANEDGFETVSLRPRMIWGPKDQSILPAVLDMIEQGKFMWVDKGRAVTNTTHIYNLRHAIFLALDMDKDIGGEAFFVTDDEVHTFKVFLGELLKTQGVVRQFGSIPGWLVRGLAFCIEVPWRMLGIKSAPPMTRFGVNIMSRDCMLDIGKAKRVLGYTPVIDVEAGLRGMERLER